MAEVDWYIMHFDNSNGNADEVMFFFIKYEGHNYYKCKCTLRITMSMQIMTSFFYEVGRAYLIQV